MAERSLLSEVSVARAPALHTLLQQIETAAEHSSTLDRLQTLADDGDG